MLHISIIGGNDRAIVIDLRAQYQQAAFVQVNQRRGQIGEILLILIYPAMLVVVRARHEGLWPPLAHHYFQFRHGPHVGPDSQPVIGHA